MWPGRKPPADLARVVKQAVSGGASGAFHLLLPGTNMPYAWLKHSYVCRSLTIQRLPSARQYWPPTRHASRTANLGSRFPFTAGRSVRSPSRQSRARVPPAVDVTTRPIRLKFRADAATQARAGSTLNFDAAAMPTNHARHGSLTSSSRVSLVR